MYAPPLRSTQPSTPARGSTMPTTISALTVAKSRVMSICDGAAGGASVPFQGAFAPHVQQGDTQHRDEHRHLGKPEPPQAAEHDRPRIHEDHLDVEHDEQD